MPRLYINFRRSLFVWVVILLLIIVPFLVLGIYASRAAPLAFIPMLLALWLPLVYLLVLPRNFLRQDRTIRAAARDDNRTAPLVIAQPEPADALAPGAMLQMTRTTPRGAILRAGSGSLFLAIFIAALNEFFVAFAFSPQLSAAQLHEGGSDLPGWFVWVFALAPLVLAVSFVAIQYYFLARERRVTITADDQGVTLKQSLRRPQFIPWDDIHVWIRGVGNSSDPYLSTYGMIGYRHRLFIQFDTAYNLLRMRAKPFLAITYSGGIAAYQTQARQLLATIAARSKVQMRTFPQGFYGPGARRILPFAQLTTTDIAALPVAQPALLPSLAAVQAMQLQPGPLSLRQRSRLPANLIVVLLFLGIIAGINIVIVVLDGSAWQTGILNFVPLIILLALVFTRFRFALNPSITVDAQGIRGGALNRQVVLPWQNVRYWVVEPPASHHPHELIYGIFSDGPTLTWRVPVSVGVDPQSVAQRATVEAFHAMIAARTGQPPRQLPAN